MRSERTPALIAAATQQATRFKEKSPPEFFVQPHELYPIAPQEFEKWLAILREHFPDNSMLADVGASTLIT